MKSENQSDQSENKQPHCWTKSDQENLIKVLAIVTEGQKAYGKEVDMKAIFAYFRMKMESRFTVDQVVYALNEYTDKRNDIPSPADIINILSPEKPRITEAQYIEACKWQERNGHPQFSDAAYLKRDYEEQEHISRRDHIAPEHKVLNGPQQKSLTKPLYKKPEDKTKSEMTPEEREAAKARVSALVSNSLKNCNEDLTER